MGTVAAASSIPQQHAATMSREEKLTELCKKLRDGVVERDATIQQLQEDLKLATSGAEGECRVCMENTTLLRLKPCGHVCICQSCLRRLPNRRSARPQLEN